MFKSICVFLVLFLISCGGTNDPSGNGSTLSKLRGHVTTASLSPVSGAKVTLSGPASWTTTTDGQGTFMFDALPPGAYDVRTTREGYVDNLQHVQIDTGYNVQVSIILVPGSNKPIYNLSLACIDSATGISIPSVAVAFDPPQELVVTSKLGGVSLILNPGTYHLTLTKSGYQTETTQVTIDTANVILKVLMKPV